jgi:hypothetical protein
MQAEAAQPNPGWVLLYRDRVAELWGRAAKYADPRSRTFIPETHRVQDASPREGNILWPALPLTIEDREVASHTHSTQSDANL